jgi:hypothetical protein
MASRRRASEARRSGLLRARPGRRPPMSMSMIRSLGGVVALALAAWVLGAGCRQSVLLDSPVDGGGTGGVGGAGGSPASGTGGDQHGNGGMFGGGHPDGGRPDALGFCFGNQLQFLNITMRSPFIIASVDRSSDMQMSFGTSTRLDFAQQQVEALMSKYRIVKWGYQEFPSTTSMCGTGQGCCAGDVVPPGYNTFRAIKGVIHACDGGGPGCNQPQRPIADALSKCYDTYQSNNNPDDLYDHRYVLLLTSGDPTCMVDATSTMTPCGEAVGRTTKLANHFTNTEVFAIGDAASASSCLDMIASFGSPDAAHAAKSPNDLAAELDTLVEEKAEEACKIDVHTPPADPKTVQLLFDGLPVPENATDGWTFDQDTNLTLTVYGSYCRTLVSNNVQVHLVSGCPLPHN